MSASTETARGLAEAVVTVASRSGRPDLAERLTTATDQLLSPRRHVLVVGEHKQGKSSLVNALLGADVCPVDDDMTSVVPCLVVHGDALAAAAVTLGPEGEQHTPLDLRARKAALCHPIDDVRWVEVAVPRRLLATGTVLVDTPGGGLTSSAGSFTVAAARTASLVIVVTDASQELSLTELDVIERVRAVCPSVLLAITKTDLTHHWERIVKLDRGHLDLRELHDVTIVATSAVLRRVALARDDGPLDARSGYPELTDRVLSAAVAGATPSALLSQVSDVLAQLTERHQAALAAAADPAAARRLGEALVDARSRADALRRASARWQQVLSDGISALTVDAEFELRARLRAQNADNDATIDAIDPAREWDELRAQVERRLADELVAVHDRLIASTSEVARRVADHFSAAGAALAVTGDLRVGTAPALPSSATTSLADIELVGSGVVNGAFSAMRGSYGSVMMFGLLASFAGLALINPITIVAGIGMGGKAVMEDRDRGLTQRRHQARIACRGVVDEAMTTATKHLRDVLRSVHHELRDGFVGRAEELQQCLDVAVAATHDSVKRATADRVAVITDLDAEAAVLDRLRTSVLALSVGAPELDRRGAPHA